MKNTKMKTPKFLRMDTYPDERYLTRLIKAMGIIEEAEDKKHIWNADFNECKDNIRYAYERAHDVVEEKARQKRDSDEQTFSQLIGLGYDNPATVQKKLSKFEYKTPVVTQFEKEIVEPLADIYNKLLALKPYIEKGRKPNPNAKPAYVPPLSSMNDLKKVKDLYTDLLKEWYPKQVEQYTDMFHRQVEAMEEMIKNYNHKNADHVRYMRNNSEIRYNFFENKNPNSFINVENQYKHYKKLPKAKLEAKIKELAEENTNRIQANFIRKNLQKVTSIIAERGALESGEPLEVYSSAGTIEGNIRFTFKDGSAFTVRNQVVTVMNERGHFFARFPTTFHDVSFAGKFHKKMSEKQMNEEFAVKKAVNKKGKKS